MARRPSEIRLQDPLSEVTRGERKTLLGLSAVGITIAVSGLVPSKISALGIEFDRTDQSALLRMLATVITYFLVAFMVYGASDFVAWRVAYRNALIDILRERRARSQSEQADYENIVKRVPGEWLAKATRPVSAVRAGFEFAIPLAVGVAAIYLLLATPPPRVATVPAAGPVIGSMQRTAPNLPK